MAQVQRARPQSNADVYSQGGQMAGNAIVPGIGGIVGGMVGAKAGEKQVIDPVAVQQAPIPQANAAEAENMIAAMQRKLAEQEAIRKANVGY